MLCMSKVKHEVIELSPTDICLEVYIGNRKDVIKLIKKNNGEKKSYWKSLIGEDSCTINLGNHIIIFLREYDPQEIVHEAVHASWELSKLVGYNFSYKNQEIQAYQVDYIIGKVLSMK